METVKDWQGRDVPAPSDPDETFPVWVIDIAPTTTEDGYMARGWQDFLELVGNVIERELENHDDDIAQLEEGITFKIRLLTKSHEEMTPESDG